MKKREKEILIQLLKNSKLSDREIAKKLKTSQSTITRTRHKLEKRFINSYTIVPDLANLDIKLIAFTFGKCSTPTEKWMKGVKDFIEKQPNMIFVGCGEGMGKTDAMVSFHNDFSDYTEFMRKSRLFCRDFGMALESFIIPTDKLVKTLDMSKTIEFLIKKKGEKEEIKNKNNYSRYYQRKILNSV